MKRRLFNFATGLSLVLSIAAAAAWATSYGRAPDWRLLAVAHTADLVRVGSGHRMARFTTAAGWSKARHHGFWDAGWVLSRAGRLTVLGQAVDYDGTLRRIDASPPSLTVYPPGEGGAHAVVFGDLPASSPGATRLGFGWHSDARMVSGVSARAWMVTVPYWLIVLLAWAIPLRRLRAARRAG